MDSFINFQYINNFLTEHKLSTIENSVTIACQEKNNKPHGDIANWRNHLSSLPKLSDIEDFKWEINDECIILKANIAGTEYNFENIENHLKALSPWRKGPFNIFSSFIDTEWNSAMKWKRLKSMGIKFNNKNILDVGCGNGFFMWQMQNAGAKSVTGVDPSWLFYFQFMSIQKYINSKKLCMLPIGVEQIAKTNCFDQVLSMGVLYHQKDPIKHLQNLKRLLKNDGELILETIVLDSNDRTILKPIERYAGMRNISMITSVPVLLNWIEDAGFKIDKTSELVKTTFIEQRQTDWMTFHSLEHFLDQNNNDLTIEGHPAPKRIVITAKV